MGFLLEDLGALNESEVFLGVLIEKSRFQRKKHAEKFGLLSQIGLSNLQRKIEGFYKQKFIDFEENKAFYAKYTYTITYYYSGCFLKDIKEEIMNLLEDFDKGNKAFLGLVWLIFAEVFLKNNKTF